MSGRFIRVSGCCELDQEFPTWLTIWPRDKMDKLFHAQTIRTGNATFDKRFNLSSDNEQEALRILNSSRTERILNLTDRSFGKFSINLNRDGKLYIAVHSGQAFFDIGKGTENPGQLRQRYAREMVYRHGGCIPHLQSLRYNLYPDRRFLFYENQYTMKYWMI